MIKKFLVLAVFMLGILTVSSQGIKVNDRPIGEIDVEYIEIVVTARALSHKVNVEIDFGQDTNFFSGSKQTRIEDEDGKRIKFNSMIDALNFMNKNGFEFVQAYVVDTDDSTICHYLMKRKE
ncbi:hypothetical protein [Pricia sp.]|uniref:hypothetical protein n=1 Tax=Pricia sp. TaxID=2268138 RepID=UPI0035936941